MWGRGTLDNKSNLVTQLEAVEALLRAGFKPRRTVHLIFGDDEEVRAASAAPRRWPNCCGNAACAWTDEAHGRHRGRAAGREAAAGVGLGEAPRVAQAHGAGGARAFVDAAGRRRQRHRHAERGAHAARPAPDDRRIHGAAAAVRWSRPVPCSDSAWRCPTCGRCCARWWKRCRPRRRRRTR
ncbi:MAG: M20/M25/M40 family metallo-hydrolase [Rubrivivax sp.]